MNEREQMATRILKRLVEFDDRMREKLTQEFHTPIGYQRASTRHIRSLVEKAFDGDMESMQEIKHLASANGHMEGEKEFCPICREISTVLSKRGRE